jgi:hypothetical protein
MSPLGLASGGSIRKLWVLAVFAVLAIASGGHADANATLLVFVPGPPPDAARWVERLTGAVGPIEVDAARFATGLVRGAGIARSRVTALSRIERQLADARAQAAALSESEALSILAQAADDGEQLADMPGAAAWNAEIQLWLAVTAAQVGLGALADSAFRRAATLDPTRHLLEAEASPEIVAQSERVQRLVALGPRGEIEVRALVQGARVILDDVLQGTAPVRVRAPVGRHVLRVQAAGHVPYATFIDVLEGERPPLSVALAEAPLLADARALERTARAGDYGSVPRALAQLDAAGAGLGAVLVLETDATGRALLVSCDAQACRRALRIQAAALPPTATWPAQPLALAGLASDRAWLAGGAPPAATESATWWQHWYVWGPLAVVAAGATAFALTYDPEPTRRLRVMVDAGDVAR